MSPRPRTVSDEQIILATQRVMSQLGPIKLTLAAVAKEAGLSAATLVQRFGSKRGLMRALWASALGGVDDCFEVQRSSHTSALDALVDAALMMPRGTHSPDEMANSLAFLHIDLTDPLDAGPGEQRVLLDEHQRVLDGSLMRLFDDGRHRRVGDRPQGRH